MLTAQEIIERLRLRPLPREGGWFAETYRAAGAIPEEPLGRGYGGARSFGTAIYYLLTPDTFSALHRLRGDEIFHFYLGDPVEMLLLRRDGSREIVTLGNDLAAGMQPQFVVPGGVWQGARLRAGGRFALLGTTMAPGFDWADFEAGEREPLVARYPKCESLIRALAREDVK